MSAILQVRDLHHGQSRERMLRCTARLLALLLEVAKCKTIVPEDLRRWVGYDQRV